ncbi:aldo/keto reductase [Nonomuraea rubra]|uniref:Aryl-alcohol dehydrogenase-like predicted oxidoreductase n=1 Tax=Nonomuraea rubra TaxID=46180 RepID=A0A7X0NPS3_9ACTN|nr:aldo/keto reductase [Nonomuraea rubra]MBB6547327.1 aryl-alcohol dehydrogenase-like predicted oxidoreductase [Nonomuraea rubra]
MTVRQLGRSGIQVSAIGFGAWAIGGPFTSGGKPAGWGEVDDDESIAAVRRALELGITFFDTADVYGTGHSERVLGRALAGRRDEVVIATKFGNVFDAGTRTVTGRDLSPGYVRRACQASLERLGTDRIDLYQLHIGDAPLEQVDDLVATLEGLVDDGLIRAYGWSTDDPERAAAFAKGPHCAAVQHELSVLRDAPAMVAVCETHELASVNRGPLAMGLLSGKYGPESRLPMNDVRGDSPAWMTLFRDGRPAPEFLAMMEAVRDILTSGGRTLAQGALGWLLGRSERTVPIPGIRTVGQAEENAGALRHGALSAAELAQIGELLQRPA